MSFSISPIQKRAWLLSRAFGVPPLIQCIIRIEGVLDQNRLGQLLCRIQEQHEILRTEVQISQSGNQVQAFQRTLDVVPELQAQHLNDFPNIEAATNNFFASCRRDHSGVFRSAILSLGDVQHFLLFSVSALYADIVSIQLVLKKLQQCWDKDAMVEDDIIQYVEIAEWQNELLQSKEGQLGREYWTEKSKVPLASAMLPDADGSGKTFVPRAKSFAFSEGFQKTLFNFSEITGMHPSVLLFAGWAAFLRRIMAGEFYVGVHLNGRSCPELSTAIGPLSRYVPLHCEFDETISLADLASKLERQVAEIERWKDFFEWPHSDEERRGPVTVPFGFEFQGDWPNFQLGEARCSLVQLNSYAEPCYMALRAWKTSGSLALQIAYNADQYSDGTMADYIERFQVLLGNLFAHPRMPLGEHSSLTSHDWEDLQVLRSSSYLPFCDLPRTWFEKSSSENRQSPALIASGQTMCFEELDHKSNQLANYLIQSGVGLETRVALALNRSFNMVIAVLAVMKTGGVYVPVDPQYPEERIRFILQDCQATVLLCDSSVDSGHIPAGCRVVNLPGNQEIIASYPGTPPALIGGPDNLAYMIYTSGSTGRPKGVMVTNRGLMNYLSWSMDHYRVAEGAGSIMHSSLSFDLTVTSLLTPLVAGQTVRLITEEDPVESLAAHLENARDLSVLKITPAHLEALGIRMTKANLKGRIRTLVVGGEALKSSTVSPWMSYSPSTRIINEYGPTETVVGCCIYEVEPNHEQPDIPIGQPIANTSLYVLNSFLQQVPPGTIGELYISGEGVARGYWGRPDLTAGKFLPDAFSDRPGTRMYRTGDLVRLSFSGQLEFLGRNDDQVKIRGFRIELGEIEATLSRHPDVLQAAVHAADGPRGKYLVGCIVPHEGSRFQESQVEEWMRQRLPEYMVPSLFIPLSHLPLTPNGKVDRSRLPSLAPEQLHTAHLPCSDPTEDALAEIWRELFNSSPAGGDANLSTFAPSARSVFQLAAKIRSRFGVDLPLKQIMFAPGLSAIASAIRELSNA